MLEIYFDNVLLDPDNYISLTQKGQIFDKEFVLGSVVSREFVLVIPKSVFNIDTQSVVIKYNSNDYAHLIIDKIEYSEGGAVPTVSLTLIDRLINANFNYDASELGTTTTLAILQDICADIGVELGTTSFVNDDVVVDFYDNTIQAREYLSYIAEIAGGFIRIESDGRLYIRKFSNTNITSQIFPELCEEIKMGEQHIIQRVVFDNGLLKYETSNDETLETLYLNPNNVYINTLSEFNNIANEIIGFQYCNMDTGSTYILPNVLPGDVLSFTYEDVVYYTISQFSNITFNGSWQGGYKLSIDSSKQQETKIVSYHSKIKNLKVIQDRLGNKIQILVTDLDTTSQNLINQITATQSMIEATSNSINQSVIELNGKLSEDISDVAQDLLNNVNTLSDDIRYSYSLIQQLKDSIISTIKSSGGTNLLRNSVGFANLDYWNNVGNITTIQDAYTESNTTSGSKFVLTGVASLIQGFATLTGKQYGISFKLRHIVNGTANNVKIRVHKTENDYIEVLPVENQATEYTDFTEFSTFLYEATTITPYIEIVSDGDDTIEISDLMISVGENTPWSGYVDEVYGKEHRLDKYGLQLTDLSSGNYSQITNNQVKIANSDNEVVAELSKNQVMSDSGYFKNKYQIRNLQIVALDNSNIVEYS